MPLFSEVRAVFFDLDDTLCGYWDACKVALRETFGEHGPGIGHGNHETEALVCRWAEAFRAFAPGLRDLGLYEGYLKSGAHTRAEQMRRTLRLLEVENEELALRLGEHYAERRNSNLRLFPDALDVLDRLRVAGYPLGLITNGPADVQRQEIDSLALADYFDPIYIEGEVGYGKPDERVLANAVRTVGLPPEKILFVGNSYRADIEPAIRAGWRTAWVRRPSDVPPSADLGLEGSPEGLPIDSPAPDVEIAHLAELIPLLGLAE